MIECLETIVGISRQECDCLSTEGQEFNISTSDSGIFLEDLLDLDLANVGPCKPGEVSVYEYMSRFLDTGANQVTSDIVATLTDNSKGSAIASSRKGWSGNFGDRTFPKTTTAAQYSGVRIDSKNLKGSKLKLKKVFVTAKATGNITIGIKNSLGETIKEETTVNITSASAWQEVTAWANTEIDLYSEESRDFAIFIYANGNDNPAANKKACAPCSGNAPWTTYLSNTGFKATDLDEYLTELQGGGYTQSEYFHGFRFEIELSCSIEKNLCDITGDSREILARAIAYNTCMRIIEGANTDLGASLFNNVQEAKLKQMHKEFFDNYVPLIQHLANTEQWGPCYVCNPTMAKRTILK